MSVAAELTGDPSHDGTAILADVQTAGRGQYGRSWLAPPRTSVLLGVLVFPPPAVRRIALLTAWATVSVAATVQHLTNRCTGIKWPNDVLLDGKKVSGILIESIAGEKPSVVVGVGLNVTQSRDDFAQAGLPDATSLVAETGLSFEVSSVASALLDELDREYQRIVDGDFADLQSLWSEQIGLLGREAVVTRNDGRELRGKLRVQTFDQLEIAQLDGSLIRLAPEAVRGLRKS